MAENIVESLTIPPDFLKIKKESIYQCILEACEKHLDSILMVRLKRKDCFIFGRVFQGLNFRTPQTVLCK